MEREHCEKPDSRVEFTTGNYHITTQAIYEWWFVNDPQRGLETLRLTDYPTESADRLASGQWRCARSLEDFEAAIEQMNSKLDAIQAARLRKEEVIGARLYTGPMYCKYNAILMCKQFSDGIPAHIRSSFAECHGNTYTTTLHCINSAVVKLSRLTKAEPVYRGVSGATLPAPFRVKNEFCVRGGIEAAFMSTTRTRSVATDYARQRAGPPIVFVISQGMVNRGADISWLSQYPHEAEILFNPLTSLEVQSMGVKDSVLLVNVTSCINLNSQTIEQVIHQRHQLLQTACNQAVDEARGALEARLHQHCFCKHTRKPIVGPRFEHIADGWSLSEPAYAKLPDGRGGRSLSGLMIHSKGDFRVVPAADVPLRMRLASSALNRLFELCTVEFCNEDAHFAVALQTPVMIKEQTSYAEPLMLRILGVDAAASALPAELDALEALQAIAIDKQSGRPASEKIAWAEEEYRGGSKLLGVRERLQLLADPQTVLLSRRMTRTALPEGLGLLHSLVELDLTFCRALVRLPESISGLAQLREVLLSGCESLKALCEAPSWTSLETLILSGCKSLERLPESLGCWTSLRRLNCQGCAALCRLPESLGQLVALEDLCLFGCLQLRPGAWLDGLRNCGQLAEIDARYCASLVPKEEGGDRPLWRLLQDHNKLVLTGGEILQPATRYTLRQLPPYHPLRERVVFEQDAELCEHTFEQLETVVPVDETESLLEGRPPSMSHGERPPFEGAPSRNSPIALIATEEGDSLPPPAAPVLESHMYPAPPREGDVVKAQITKVVQDMGIFLSLVEYAKGVEGMLMAKELSCSGSSSGGGASSSRSTKLHTTHRVGKYVTCRIKKLTTKQEGPDAPITYFIDLKQESKPEHFRECERRWQRSLAVHTLFSHVAREHGHALSTLYEQVVWPLHSAGYGHAYVALTTTDTEVVDKLLDRAAVPNIRVQLRESIALGKLPSPDEVAEAESRAVSAFITKRSASRKSKKGHRDHD